MGNRIKFMLKEENDIVLNDGVFKGVSNGIWLTMHTDLISINVCQIAEEVSELKYDEIMDMINPFNIDTLLYKNLSSVEFDEVDYLLKNSNEYYLYLSDNIITIRKPTEGEIEEYKTEFENTLYKAISEYGSDNIDIVYDEDSHLIEIMYCSKHNSFGACERSFSPNYINEEFIDSMRYKYDCGYVV